jgi:membrane protein implicated in regulation of membrane protease activity
MRRTRTRLILGAIAVALLWLGLVLPHLLAAWPQVLVFVGIVVAAAWGWGKVAKAPSRSSSRAETPVEANVDATAERELADR